MTKPTVGRIVHYQSYGTPGGEYWPQARAAIITAAERMCGEGDSESEYDYDVDLCVLNPAGIFFTHGVIYSPEPKPGHWSWPPRV